MKSDRISILGMAAVVLVIGGLVVAGCKQKPQSEQTEPAGAVERTGAAMDTAAEKTAEAASTVAEKTVEAAKATATATKEAAGKVVKKTGEVMEKAGAAVEDAGAGMQE